MDYKNDLLNVTPVWDKTAKAYHQFITEANSYVQSIELPIITQLLDSISFSNVLDLGCGTGHYTLKLATKSRVTAIDLSAEMLAVAREAAVRDGLSPTFLQHDITKPLPFQNAEFDLIVSTTALHYVEDLAAFFQECSRLLKPSGNLILSLLHPISTGLFPTVDQDYRDSRCWDLKYFSSKRRRYFPPWSSVDPDSSEDALQCYHHTLQDYLQPLLAHFKLLVISEPRPDRDFAERNPERYFYSNSQPLFLIIHAKRD
ncbi:MAG: class I SAM-dependent methyltransferase [Blastocatellia bacterium]|nr:class I SAM-dependent methyltransferase [Blastocatellia bacterium]